MHQIMLFVFWPLQKLSTKKVLSPYFVKIQVIEAFCRISDIFVLVGITTILET